MSVPSPTVPMVNAGLLYVNGLGISAGALDAGTGLFCTTLAIGGGQARDSTNVNDITLPITNAAGSTIVYVLSTSTTVIGQVNGLDQGAGLTANALYGVYAIGDSRSYQPSGTLLSLSFTAPQLPEGYDMFRRIGTVKANSAGTGILAFNQRGNGAGRSTWYCVPIATAVAAGASTSFAPVTLTTFVPTTGGQVYILSALTSDAGGTRTVVYSADATVTIAHAATAGEVIQSSPASTVTSSSLVVPVTTAAGVQTIQYAVSNAAAAVAVSVQGFLDYL